MIEACAIVVSANAMKALVRPELDAVCGQCERSGGCALAKLGGLLPWSTHYDFMVDNRANARPGDRVLVGVDVQALWRGALVGYGFPLAMLLLGATLFPHLFAADPAQDLPAAIGACAGFVVGFFCARIATARRVRGRNFDPIILAVVQHYSLSRKR